MCDHFHGNLYITGGAGVFANAKGSGTITTEFNLCAGTADRDVYGDDLPAELELRGNLRGKFQHVREIEHF